MLGPCSSGGTSPFLVWSDGDTAEAPVTRLPHGARFCGEAHGEHHGGRREGRVQGGDGEGQEMAGGEHRGPCIARRPRTTHRVRLVLAAVELVAVVEDVLVGGVEAGFHAVLHHLAGSGRALQLLDLRGEAAGLRAEPAAGEPGLQSCNSQGGKYLHPEKGDAGQQIHRGLEVLQPLGTAGREVILGEKKEELVAKEELLAGLRLGGGESRPY